MRLSTLTFACLLVAGCRFTVAGFGADAQVPGDLGPGGDAGVNRVLGSACTSANQCASGFCSDGLCCDQACDAASAQNLCKACNVPGLEGHCTFEPAGMDPRNQCADDGAATCGHDGTCDGAGQCRRYSAGTPCGTATCANGMATYAPACDGNGTCVAQSPLPCAPYVCADATACYSTCSDDSQCDQQHSCDNGSCGKRANGQPCSSDNDCGSDECHQGVCCATACDGTCESCNIPGQVGTCAKVPAGDDPLNQCNQDSQASCGHDGQCDGRGACELWSASTVCEKASCMNGSSSSARQCDGLGACRPATITSCGNYACDTLFGQCFSAPCFSNFQCAPGKSCKGGHCK